MENEDAIAKTDAKVNGKADAKTDAKVDEKTDGKESNNLNVNVNDQVTGKRNGKIWIVLALVLFSGVLGGLTYHILSKNEVSGVEVDWRMLGEMDYVTSKATPELQNLNEKKVKIPGFMVPLEDSSRSVTEFLLVPTPQACIHVPAPPPNQMVYVKMKASSKTPVAYGPIWAIGTLRIVTKKSMYGDSSFELEGDLVEPYK